MLPRVHYRSKQWWSRRTVLTELGLRTALFWSRAYARILRPGLTRLHPDYPEVPTSTLRIAFNRLETVVDDFCDQARLAA